MGTRVDAWFGTVVVLLAFTVGLGLPALVRAAAPADKLVLGLDWTPGTNHLFLFVAREKGFFKDENLEVEFQVPSGTTDPLKRLAQGDLDLAVGYMLDTILARSRDISVTAIMALVQEPLNTLTTLKTSGITQPRQLKGKKVGTSGPPAINAGLASMLETASLSLSDVELVNIGFNLSPALISGRVDAIIGAYYGAEPTLIELRGYPVNVLRVQDFGAPHYYELVLLAREDTLGTRRSVLERFLRAAIRGDHYMIRHPDEALELFLRLFPEKDRRFTAASLQARIPLILGETAPYIGFMKQEDWQNTQQWMLKHRLIKRGTPVEHMFTVDLLPKTSVPR